MRARALASPGVRRLRLHPALGSLLVVVLFFGLAWVFLVPPWQAPDEPQHFSYIETLGENHRVPGGSGDMYAADLYYSLAATNFNSPIFVPEANPEWSRIKGAQSRRAMKARSRDTGGGPTTASSYPPAYYLAATPAYLVLRTQATTTRLYGVRAWSLLWLLLNVAAIWALTGELFGRRPIAQLAASATVGLWPMVTFVTAAVNPDGALMALFSLAFALGTRAAIRGLTLKRGVLLGLTVGLAFVVKDTALALVPPTLALFAYLLWRERRRCPGRDAVLLGLGSLAALALFPVAWSVITRLSQRAAFAHAAGVAGGGVNLREFFSYLWQFYLPPLGFMQPIHFGYPVISSRPVLNLWLGTGTATVWLGKHLVPAARLLDRRSVDRRHNRSRPWSQLLAPADRFPSLGHDSSLYFSWV